MVKRKVRLVLTLSVLVFSCILLAWASWSFGSSPRVLYTKGLNIMLDSPSIIRAGDSDNVVLWVESDSIYEMTPTAEVARVVTTSDKAWVQDNYDTYNVVAAARLDLAGMKVVPYDMILQPLHHGESVDFYWSASPDIVGRYSGTVWLYMQYIPIAGGVKVEEAISAQTIKIEVVSFLGLKSGTARILGMMGVFLGFLLGLPFLKNWLRRMWGRFRQ